jgi:hypothetical protein
MAEEILKIKIGADISEVSKSLSQLEKEFKDLQASIKIAKPKDLPALNSELEKLATTIQRVKNVGRTGFDQYGQDVSKLAKNIAQVTPAASRATQSMIGMGRVMQDLAFGPIAIANNIEPLLLSFRELGTASGGFKNAAGALASSLLGGGGLILAFSALTFFMSGGLDTLKQYIPGWKNLAKAQKEAAESAKKHAEETHNAAISMEQQKINLGLLVDTAKGDIGSKEQQVIAIKKLNEVIPDYIGVLSNQNIATAEGTRIIGEYIKQLEKQATAELLIGQLAEINVKKIEEKQDLEKRLTQNLNQQKNIQAQLDAARAKNNDGLIGAGADLQSSSIDALAGQLAALKIAYNEDMKAFQASRAGMIATQKKLRDEIGKNSTILDTGGDKKIQSEAERQRIEYEKYIQMLNSLEVDANAARVGIIGAGGTGGLFTTPVAGETQIPRVSAGIDALAESFNNLNLPKANSDLTLTGAKEGANNVDKLSKSFIDVNEELKTNKELIGAIGGLLTNAFEKGLTSGKNFFKGLIDGLKQLVVRLLAAAAAATILNAVTGGKAGTFLELFSQFSGFDASKFKKGSTVAPSGFAGGSALNVAPGGAFGGQVLFEIQGQKLVGVLNRVQTSNRING